jgi:hypothetical protein
MATNAEMVRSWRATERGKAIMKSNSDRWRKSDKGINYRWKQQGIVIGGRDFTTVDYDYAYQVQQGCCAACRKHAAELNRKLFPDHDHKTGEFRWLLCNRCNGILGYVYDDPEILERMAKLLRSRIK